MTSPKIKRFINQSFRPHHDATLLSCYDAMMSLLLILKMSYLEDREIEMQCYTYFESLKFSRASKDYYVVLYVGGRLYGIDVLESLVELSICVELRPLC